uniref:G-protein coupled receptors family 1 profile domain-containing protein n=1 Tax=Plectus sambesii TaxID=2011161 RepID=A0A914VBF9_9BILA
MSTSDDDGMPQNFSLLDAEEPEKNFLFLGLAVVPIAAIVGNCLVVAAVWTTRSLQTSTNYLLVSLAVADLVVSAFVMPFSIYLSVNGLHWHLPVMVCNFYCILDVSASTSSIVHLVTISVDRYVAATKPADYKTPMHRRRVHMAIFGCWFFSVSVALPLGIGLNTNAEEFVKTKHHCGIYNPSYMLYSSLFAFYIPCAVMLVTYSYIFYTLRKRLRAIQLQEMAGGQFLGFSADVGNIAQSAIQHVIGIAPKNRMVISWEKPLLKKIEETAAEHASSLNDSEREQLQTILECVHPSSSVSQELTTEDDPERPQSVILDAVTIKEPIERRESLGPVLAVPKPAYRNKHVGRRFSDAVQSLAHRKTQSYPGDETERRRHSHQIGISKDSISEESRNLHGLRPAMVEARKMRRLSEMISDWGNPSRPSLGGFSQNLYSFARRESLYIARKKLAGLKDWALELLAKLKSKQGMAIRRETRATKLVATVMVVFLVCWLPFFTLNMIKVYKLWYGDWSTDLEVWFHWFTALGYLNSSLNPIIYTMINQKFRSSFRRLIGLRSRRKREHSWMTPPRAPRRVKSIGCGPFHKIAKKSPMRRCSSAGVLQRRMSVAKPEIVIDEVSPSHNSPNCVSMSFGNTTIRRSSDESTIRRSSSEILPGVKQFISSQEQQRRGSNMSNSSASLQLHEIRHTAFVHDVEIFV